MTIKEWIKEAKLVEYWTAVPVPGGFPYLVKRFGPSIYHRFPLIPVVVGSVHLAEYPGLWKSVGEMTRFTARGEEPIKTELNLTSLHAFMTCPVTPMDQHLEMWMNAILEFAAANDCPIQLSPNGYLKHDDNKTWSRKEGYVAFFQTKGISFRGETPTVELLNKKNPTEAEQLQIANYAFFLQSCEEQKHTCKPGLWTRLKSIHPERTYWWPLPTDPEKPTIKPEHNPSSSASSSSISSFSSDALSSSSLLSSSSSSSRVIVKKSVASGRGVFVTCDTPMNTAVCHYDGYPKNDKCTPQDE